MASLSGLSHEERAARLQQRTREAETALKQLRICIEVIKQQSHEKREAQSSSQVQELAKENEQLRLEVNQLKQKLIDLELMNGVEQIPLPQVTIPQVKAERPLPCSDSHECSVQPTQPQDQSNPSPNQVTPSKNNGGKSSPDAGNAQKSGAKSDKGKSKKQPAASGQSSTASAVVDVSRLDFRIGLIKTAKRHPEADTLYVEEIDIGEETPRTVCSGLVKHIPLDEIQNRYVVMLCNLKPVKMRGVVSAAMVMCASSEDKIEIIDPPAGVVPGEQVLFEGYTGTPDAQLNPKKKIFEQVQPDLRTNSECVACYRSIPFTVAGKGICTVPSLKDCIIK